MMKAYLYNENKYLIGEINCQKDPLESKAKGYDVYLKPANSTEVEPLKPKEGYTQKFIKGSWVYEELPKQEEVELFNETEKGKLLIELQAKQGQLQQLDYIGIKIATGRATVGDYKDEIEQMNILAEEINKVKNKLKELGY